MDNNAHIQDRESQELLKKLSSLSVSFPSEELKARMKSRVMFSLRHEKNEEISVSLFECLIGQLKNIAVMVTPDALLRAKMKERVFAYIESTLKARPVFFLQRRFVSAFLVLAIVLTTFFTAKMPIPVTLAREITILENVSGDVRVSRGSEVFQAKNGFTLVEGDVISTGSQGSVDIHYFDNSVSRLDRDTEVEIATLGSEKGEEASIEVDLRAGHMWSRVLSSLNDNLQFSVRVAKVKTEAQKKAAFDIVALPDAFRVQVFNSVVDVVVEEKASKVVKPVIKGYQVTVKQKEKQPVVVLQQDAEKNEWVNDNLEKDKTYFNVLAIEDKKVREENVGLLPNDPLYPVKTLKENASLLLTFDEIEKEKVKLNFARRRFIEAIVLLDQDRTAEAEEALKAYQETIKSVQEKFNVLLGAEPKQAQVLGEALQQVLRESKRNVEAALPGQPLYKAREAVSIAELGLASNDSERQIKALQQKSEALLDMQDLVASGKPELVQEKLSEFQEQSRETLREVQKLSEVEKAEVLPILLEKQKDAVKVLTVLEKGDVPQVSERAKEVKEESLKNVTEAVTTMSSSDTGEDVKEIVQEINVVAETYDSDKQASAATEAPSATVRVSPATLDAALEGTQSTESQSEPVPTVRKVFSPKLQLKEEYSDTRSE